MWHAHLARDSRAGRPCHFPKLKVFRGRCLHMRLIATLLLLFGLVAIGLLCDTPQLSTAHSLAPATDAAPNRGWPHPIPLRVRDGANRDLMVMTLGDVETPLADGMYDPTTDEATLKDGSIIKNYYREKLGVKYFKAIDKTNFPLPPSGWCTWYYYYQQINETEVKQNARWIAANLFVESAGLDAVTLKWSAQYYLNAGYQVYLNGALIGYTPTNSFTLRGLDPAATYTAEVRTVWEDGTASERKAELKLTMFARPGFANRDQESASAAGNLAA